MTSLESLIEQPLVHRFGLTLLHFLWQGAAVALLMAFVLRRSRRRSPELRYLASVAGLGLMAVLPVVTFSFIEVPVAPSGEAGRLARAEMQAWESPRGVDPDDSLPAPAVAEGFSQGGPDVFSEADSTPSAPDPASTSREPLPNAGRGWASTCLARVARWLDDLRPLLPWVVCAWAVGVLSFSARLASGWLCVLRMKRHSTPMVTEPAVQMVRRLSTRLGIRRAVTLLESTLVAVPSSVGFLRPVILLPASTLMGLSPEQLESVLAHELAHVRRYDYLVNVLQCIVETLLFYHPAVWWISRRIRAERENCCDDLAVSVVGSRLVYARALVDVASLGSRQQQLTAAVDGADLASRIRRVVGAAPIASERLSSWWAGAILMAILGGIALMLSLEATAGSTQAERDEAATAEENAESPGNADGKQPAKDAAFRMFDGFEGELELDWKPIRPDPTHVSFTKNPGRLTITTQTGSIYRGRAGAKNIHLLPNPGPEDGDFVVTACIESFHPRVPYQQAGLLVYNDDDNYLKWVLECGPSNVRFACVRETNQQPVGSYGPVPELPGPERFWLRLIKRGEWYECSCSTDGQEYTVASEEVWVAGPPRWIGLLAKSAQGTVETDAQFDFFEVRSLTPAEKNAPHFVERQRFEGTWQVVSRRSSGRSLDTLPASWFRFARDGLKMVEGTRSINARYGVRVKDERNELVLFSVWHDEAIRALYRLKDDTLLMCFDPRPGSPAPAELETNEGDGRMLVALRRVSAIEAAALERGSLSLKQFVDRLDADGDGQLTLDEFTADRPTPEAAKQGTEVFRLIDQDGDGKMTVDEFGFKPTRAVFLLMDVNADAALSFDEFSLSARDSVSAAQTTRIFALVDRDHDGAISSQEYTSRPAEAWFIKLDANDDQRLSLEEYVKGNSHLVRSGHVERVFRLLDRNGDGRLEAAEYARQPAECSFLFRDADGDGRLTFREFCHWWHTPEQVAAAKEEFGRKDADGDALLSFREHAYRSDDAEFWNADQNGDDRLSLDEFKAGGLSETAGQAEAAFQSIDQNGDGSISVAEFATRPAAKDPKGVGDAR